MKEKVRYAGFWIRFIASFFDTLFLALPVGIVIYFLSDGNWFDFSQYQQNITMAMSGNVQALENMPKTNATWETINFIVVTTITIMFWKKWRGATPGKRFCNIKIVDNKTFNDITNTQAFTRFLGYFASILTLCIGFLVVGFKNDKRGLHDLLAGTAVIYDKQPLKA